MPFEALTNVRATRKVACFPACFETIRSNLLLSPFVRFLSFLVSVLGSLSPSSMLEVIVE